jgi:hypothetical protein
LKLLGRWISTEGLEVLQDKLAAVRQLEPPCNLRELSHVLGLFGYCKSFIHRYSIIAAQLTELMKGIKPDKKPDGTYTHRLGDTLIDWSDACQEAFETLKAKLTNPPVLAYPDFTNPFVLYVDASHSGMACALHQISQVPRPAERDTEANMMLPETTEQLAALQRKDPTWRKVMENIEMFAQFTMRQGVLFHEEARCLPHDKEFMAKVLHDAHDTNGHMGISKSYDVMSKQWYWPGMLNILTAYVNSCVICKGAKKSRQRPSGRMHPQRNLTALVFDNTALDIFSLPLSDGYDACLTIMDTFTKMVILQPTRSTACTEHVAEMLFTSVICKGFLPSTIISDRDPKYTSDLWAAVMEKLGTKIQLTTPYHWHQQADPAERTIQTVQSVLRCYNGVDWVKRLPYVELALNEANNDSTGFAPHDLLYIARKGPVADRFAETDNYENAPELLAQAKHRIREAMANIKLAQGKQKLNYDKRHREPLWDKGLVGWFDFNNRKPDD